MKKCNKILTSIVLIITAFGVLSAAAGIFINAEAANTFQTEFEEYEGKIITPTGDFIQPWMCTEWEVADFERHFDMLSAAGYDTVLWQSVTSGGGTNAIYYPSETIDEYYGEVSRDSETLTVKLLEAAANKGFKVFMGLASDTDWWEAKNIYDKYYHIKKADKDNAIAEELYTLYKESYPDTFYGWYWSWELWTNPIGLEKNWVEMFNRTRAKLDQIDSSMPLLFSPFVSKYLRLEGGVNLRMWERFFKAAEFKEGDIFAPQDSIGNISGADVDKKSLVATLKFLETCAEAVKINPKVKFYVNCELFARGKLFAPQDKFDTASLERIEYQLKAASRYAEGIITFSYSHYMIPDAPNGTYEDQNKNHLDYIEMIKRLNNDLE